MSIGTVYTLIALIVPVAIHKVAPQCTIEYSSYSAGYAQSDRPWWTYAIAYLVVLFPAFDVFSCFPLMALSISNNLLTMRYGVVDVDQRIQRKFRILTVVVPLAISFVMFNLGDIIDWIGIAGFILVSIAIPLMHNSAREMISIPSHYDAPFYSRVIII